MAKKKRADIKIGDMLAPLGAIALLALLAPHANTDTALARMVRPKKQINPTQGMPSDTLSLERLRSDMTYPSKYILATSHRLKMIDIDALMVSAKVINVVLGGNRPNTQFKRNAVSRDHYPALVAFNAKSSVAFRDKTCSPEPAGAKFGAVFRSGPVKVNFGPESVVCCKLSSHRNLQCSGDMGPDVIASRPHLFYHGERN